MNIPLLYCEKKLAAKVVCSRAHAWYWWYSILLITLFMVKSICTWYIHPAKNRIWLESKEAPIYLKVAEEFIHLWVILRNWLLTQAWKCLNSKCLSVSDLKAYRTWALHLSSQPRLCLCKGLHHVTRNVHQNLSRSYKLPLPKSLSSNIHGVKQDQNLLPCRKQLSTASVQRHPLVPPVRTCFM